MSDAPPSRETDRPGLSGVGGKERAFTPRIVVGRHYDDRWCTPYVRGEFTLPPGDYVLDVDVWNPPHPEFERNEIVLRAGLRLLYASGPLVAEEGRQIEVGLTFSDYVEALSISIRSSIEWQPPPPDGRRLGFALLRWAIRPAPHEPPEAPAELTDAS